MFQVIRLNWVIAPRSNQKWFCARRSSPITLMHTFSLRWLGHCALLAVLAVATAAAAQKLPIEKIKLPPGFEISVFADNVPNARAMALGDQGTLFVGSMRAGKVYAIRIRDNKAVETLTIASGLNMPVDVAFRSGALYISDVSRILRLDNIEAILAIR